MSRHYLRAVASWSIVALVCAACGTAAPTVTPTLVPTAVPSPVPTPTPTPTPAPAASPTIPGLSTGNQQAGTYRTRQNNPQVLLTLPQGWSVFFDEAGGTFIGLGEAELLVSKSSDVIDPVTDERAPNPADVMAWLVAHPDLNATDPTPVVISGYDASYIEIEPTESVDVFYDPLGNFHVGPGRIARFYVIPWDGPDLFIAVLKSRTGTLEEALTVGVPIVESIQIAE